MDGVTRVIGVHPGANHRCGNMATAIAVNTAG